MRARIAAAAARIMAEDGIDDFALAKRKAARQLGAGNTQALPGNDEIETELEAYPSSISPMSTRCGAPTEQGQRPRPMRASSASRPTTGRVLKGAPAPYARSTRSCSTERKEVEIFLLEHNVAFTTHESRRYSGDRARAVSVFSLTWHGTPLKLSVFDPRDERLALKTSAAGKVMERAGIAEVGALLGQIRE